MRNAVGHIIEVKQMRYGQAVKLVVLLLNREPSGVFVR